MKIVEKSTLERNRLVVSVGGIVVDLKNNLLKFVFFHLILSQEYSYSDIVICIPQIKIELPS